MDNSSAAAGGHVGVAMGTDWKRGPSPGMGFRAVDPICGMYSGGLPHDVSQTTPFARYVRSQFRDFNFAVLILRF